MTSESYEALKAELLNLACVFLDFPANNLGNYGQVDLTKAAAYTVLAHAEIETYFETRVGDVVTAAEDFWVSQQKATPSLLSICCFAAEEGGPPAQKPKTDVWNERVRRSISKVRGNISNNNGVKTGNIFPLIAAIGFDVRTINDELTTELDSFAVMRGDHAHKTSSLRLGQVFDPFERKKKVEDIARLLAQFDESFSVFCDAQFGDEYRPPVPTPFWVKFIRWLCSSLGAP